MTEPVIQYDTMVQVALLSVVRDVLQDISDKGLPGEHHFYITFSTDHPNVIIPPYLRERYPEEMTIVIQNQFSNLLVSDSHFEISLSFNGKLEHLSIPFQALQGFFDPSVDFGLHFHSEMDNDTINDLPAITDDAATGKGASPEDREDGEDDEAGNVVALDSFRKK